MVFKQSILTIKTQLMLICFLLPIGTFGQIVKKNPSETIRMFLTRVAPDHSVLAQCLKNEQPCIADSIITTTWNNQPCLIAFYSKTDYQPTKNNPTPDSFYFTIAEIFFDIGNGSYFRTKIDSFEEEGDIAQVNTLFFTNADKNKDDELIIIVSWEQRHYDVDGTLFATYIYKDITEKDGHTIRLLKKISDKLSGGCDCAWRDGKSRKAKFKTEAQIKKELNRFGYK